MSATLTSFRQARAEPTSAVILGLAVAAWAALVAIAASPWAGQFTHAALEDVGARPWEALTLSAGWMLMVVATMLPTTLPLIAMFGRLTAGRDDRRRLRALLVLSYAGVWMVAGAAMHAGDLGIHQLVHRWPWLEANTWAIGAATLGLAGVYEASNAKARCLRRCRTPQSFLRRRWRGGRPGWQALRIGLDHGLSCLGCCWALMLVMFSVGVADLLWMLGLTAVMAVEKTSAYGARARAPVAIWLLACGLLTVLAG